MRISENNKELFEALANFQKNVTDPKKDKGVDYGRTKFSYADLDSVLKVVRPLLAEQGLCFTQIPMTEGNRVGVMTIIMHCSGQYIESDPFLIPAQKQDAQGYGSCITYAKRYSLTALLGISSDEDDDGNYGSGSDKKPEPINKQQSNRVQDNKQSQGNKQPQQNQLPQGIGKGSDNTEWLNMQKKKLADKCEKAQLDKRFVMVCMEVKYNKPAKEFTLDDYTSFVINFDKDIAETQEKAIKLMGAAS